MNDFTYYGVTTKVVDGDTVDAVIDLGFNIMTRVRFRLNDINAPELKGDTLEKGLQAKKYLEDILLNKPAIFISHSKDRYGRYLATISLRDSNTTVNQLLLDAGLADKYK